MISDIGFKTANMFKDSNELFHKLEETFDPEAMIQSAELIDKKGRDTHVKHSTTFHSKDSNVTDLDKLKEQNAIESMRFKMETLKENVIKKKLNSMQWMEYVLITIVLVLVIVLIWMCINKNQQAEMGRRYEDSFMNNF